MTRHSFLLFILSVTTFSSALSNQALAIDKTPASPPQSARNKHIIPKLKKNAEDLENSQLHRNLTTEINVFDKEELKNIQPTPFKNLQKLLRSPFSSVTLRNLVLDENCVTSLIKALHKNRQNLESIHLKVVSEMRFHRQDHSTAANEHQNYDYNQKQFLQTLIEASSLKVFSVSRGIIDYLLPSTDKSDKPSIFLEKLLTSLPETLKVLDFSNCYFTPEQISIIFKKLPRFQNLEFCALSFTSHYQKIMKELDPNTSSTGNALSRKPPKAPIFKALPTSVKDSLVDFELAYPDLPKSLKTLSLSNFYPIVHHFTSLDTSQGPSLFGKSSTLINAVKNLHGLDQHTMDWMFRTTSPRKRPINK